ncbi:MAG: squalene/phytoene synthase family protein [Alphaproteobacteria bacterium]|nr:squalene/phytoene synthase family protein [Alphaproteobacteria bacterium]
MSQNLPYCAQLVKTHDPDRFLLSMLYPRAVRPALWALFAFNHEIAKTREVVSETRLGLMRLQWWKDEIGKLYDGTPPPDHEVLAPLSDAITRYNLPFESFERLMCAREFDLEDRRPSNIEGLLNYADFTTSPLMAMALRITQEAEEPEILRRVSVNYALAGIVRSVPFMAAHRRCLLPEDLMVKHEQRMDKFYEFKRVEGFPEIIKKLSMQGQGAIKPQSRLLKAAQNLSKQYFKQLKSCAYDPFHPRMKLDPPLKVLYTVLSSI